MARWKHIKTGNHAIFKYIRGLVTGNIRIETDNLNILLSRAHVSFYLYSLHDFISMSSSLTRQKALMNADAKRLFVMSGTLRSMAARRIL